MSTLIKTITLSTPSTAFKGVGITPYYFILSSTALDSIYICNKEGKLLKTLDVSGIDTDPSYVSYFGNQIVFYGRQNKKLYFLDYNGNVVFSFSSIGLVTYVSGFSHDYYSFYFLDKTNKTLVRTTLTGELINSISTAHLSATLSALTFISNRFYFSETTADVILVTDRKLNTVRTLSLGSASFNIIGIGNDSRYLYTIAYAPNKLMLSTYN